MFLGKLRIDAIYIILFFWLLTLVLREEFVMHRYLAKSALDKTNSLNLTKVMMFVNIQTIRYYWHITWNLIFIPGFLYKKEYL
jgi:hypothetical protein